MPGGPDYPGAGRSRQPTGPKTLFVVEQNEKLQDAFREKFKEHGYRVLLTIDPSQAVKRYQQQAYHAIIIDARTVRREGVTAFNEVLRAADSAGLQPERDSAPRRGPGGLGTRAAAGTAQGGKC